MESDSKPLVFLCGFSITINQKHVPYSINRRTGLPFFSGSHGELNGLTGSEERTASGFASYLAKCASAIVQVLEKVPNPLELPLEEPLLGDPPPFPRGVRVRLGTFYVSVEGKIVALSGSITPDGNPCPPAWFKEWREGAYRARDIALAYTLAHRLNRAAWRAAVTPLGESHPIIDFIEKRAGHKVRP